MSEPRIPYPAGDTDPAGLNIERMFGHIAEDLRPGFSALAGAVMRTKSLDPLLREIAILRVGHLSDCAYEQFQHQTFARYLGMAEDKIRAIKTSADNPIFDAKEKAIMRFVDEIVRDVRPSDSALATMREHFGIEGTFTVLIAACQYMTISRILETTGVPIEDSANVGLGRLKNSQATAAAQ